MEGFITKNISNDYVVKTNKHVYNCKARGLFKKNKITPLVGDKVIFDEKNNYILEIKPRKNSLLRPPVSNVDQALIVTSVKEPNLDTYLLDKLLTIISYNNIEPIICFTKIDLLNKEEKQYINNFINYYSSIGYKVVTNEYKSNFENIFNKKITVLTGQSGAGKSTLLNLLNPNLKLQTKEISHALNRGKHTTRHTELFQVLSGYVVDTPGFSQVELDGMKATDIRDNMKEMFNNLHYCKYRDCMHIGEEECFVKKLVEEEKILKTRYINYKNFIDTVK